MRSELALAPLITPVMLKEPPAKLSTVPFLERLPDSVNVSPVLRRVPVPPVTEMLRSMVAAAPV